MHNRKKHPLFFDKQSKMKRFVNILLIEIYFNIYGF